MRGFKLAKYNVKSSLKPIIIYYLIFTGAITGIELMSRMSGGNGNSSGLEFSSIVFLFVAGLNSFRENFYFSQANNIPRLDYFKATAISIVPISFAMAVVDVIINRVYNLFRVCPTMYDMSYNNVFKGSLNMEAWVQSNSIRTILGTVTFLFAFYIVVYAVGLLVTMIYYKCNKTMKILVSVSPVAVIAIFGRIAVNNPLFIDKVIVFIDNILGISAKNSYTAVLTFICTFLILLSLVYMLVRKAVVKRV